MIKKISLLVFLFFLAIGGSLAILWASQELMKTNVQTIDDIGPAYRLASGFANTSKVQEQSPNGALGTTVTTTLRVETPERLTQGLTDLRTDLNNASNDQLINANVTIKYGTSKEYTLKFFPTTPGDYEEANFDNIINLYSSLINQDYSTFDLTVYPTTSGRYVIATGSDVNFTGEAITRQKDLVSTLQRSIPVGYGNVFDVSYKNQTTSQDKGSQTFVIETFYTSEWSYDQALNINFNNIEAFRSGKNSFVNASTIKYVRGDQPNTDQMVLVIPETDEAGLQSIRDQMTKCEQDKVVTPTSFTIYVRYALDGPDVLTFRNYYSY